MREDFKSRLIARANAFALPLVFAALAATAAGQGSGPNLKERARELVRYLEEGRFVSAVALFDDNYKVMMPPERLGEFWKAQAARYGAYEGSAPGERGETVSEHACVVIAVKFANKGMMDIRVFFNAEGQVNSVAISPASTAEPAFEAPAYANAQQYAEEECPVVTGEIKLPGTLTLPRGEGPFPGVVLISGRGANDRDHTIGANKPFRDLAWGLAARGIASLRYDKRTLAYRDGLDIKTLTYNEEIADDAVAAIKRLRRDARIDRAQVFALGHGLGGQLIPAIAGRARGNILGDNVVATSIPFTTGSIYLAGLAILGGSARPLKEVIADQLNTIANHDGKVSLEEISSVLDFQSKIEAMIEKRDASAPPVMGITWNYLRTLNDYDCLRAAQKIGLPFFIAQGGRDFEVSPEKDFGLWRRALGGRPSATFKLYPSLNHYFIAGEGSASSPGEYELPSHVDSALIADLADWILRTAEAEH